MIIDKFEDPDNSLIALIGFVAFVAFIALELSQSKVSIMANIAEGFSRKGNFSTSFMDKQKKFSVKYPTL